MNYHELSIQILSDITIWMKYARYLPELNRRETWNEIVDRNKEMHIKKFPFLKDEIEEKYKLVYEKKVLPSMRALQFSGKAVDVNNARLFNCSAISINSWESFSEIMFLLLTGCGVGISVQKHHVEQLPEIKKPLKRTKKFLIMDSLIGWAEAIKVLMKSYFFGTQKVRFDFSDIRPKGSPLVTSGGKAPGPQPLMDCIYELTKILDSKEQGTKLTPFECHLMCCYIADAVLAGGIRRAALISLFSLSDKEMMQCKYGNWFEQYPCLGRANNSVVILRHKITKKVFFELWDKIKASRTGEPAIFLTNNKEMLMNPCQCGTATVMTPEGIKTFDDINIGSIIWSGKQWTKVINKVNTGIKPVYEYHTEFGSFIGTKEHRVVSNAEKTEVQYVKTIDDDKGNTHKITFINFLGDLPVYDITVDAEEHTYWTGGLLASNCSEISIPSEGFCNLTTINFSTVKDQADLNERVKAAAFIGTLQASYTDFHYLRDSWKKNADKEALLGVSMTGLASGNLEELDLVEAVEIVKEENIRIANLIGINPAHRLTCEKPEGSSSLVVGSSSGIHAWHSKYYIRRLRIYKTEPLYKYLKAKIPQLVKDEYFKPNIQAVIEIPIEAPDGAAYSDEPAIDLLERIKKTYSEWVKPGHIKGDNTHNVSATVLIGSDEEWAQVGKWMWENRKYYNGISVLPRDLGTYVQAPFETITKEKFEELSQYLAQIDLSEVKEDDDNTNPIEQAACMGGACNLI